MRPPAHQFDLATTAFIPVRPAPSEDLPSLMSLVDLLTCAHRIQDLLVGPPPALSAFYRLLYAITARITGLHHASDGAEDWSMRRLELLETGHLNPHQVLDYFGEFSGRFHLFDPERPFLQDPRLATQCKERAGVNKLVLGRPAKNGPSWFNGHYLHAAPVPVPAAEALWNLLVWHYYGEPGQCSSRDLGTRPPKGNMLAGPLRAALSFHPLGESLFGTLLAGLPLPARGTDPTRDLCPWELPELADPASAPEQPVGPRSGLTGRSHHALLLIPDAHGEHVVDAYLTWAWHEGRIERGDDYLIWSLKKDGTPIARPASASRGLWRDLDSLLLAQAPGQDGTRPAIFTTSHEVNDVLRVRALGIDQEAAQVGDHQFVSATTPPVLDLMDIHQPGIATQIGLLRAAGESAGERLRQATDHVRKELGPRSGDNPWSRRALQRYWPRAEALFWQRLAARDFAGAPAAFARIAHEVYTQTTATAVGTVRGARVCEYARWLHLEGGAGTKKTPTRATAPTGPKETA